MNDITEQTIEEQSSGQQTPGAAAAPGANRDRSPGAAVAPGAETVAPASAAGDSGELGDEHALQGDVDELVRLAAQRDEYLALAQRTQADFENYRKRTAREASLAQERGVAKLAKELLPALDNLDRSVEAAATAAEGSGQGQQDPLLDGVRLVRSELGAALGRLGIESFSPLGEAFDPAEHEAVAQQPVPDAESGTVAEVYQAGYRLSGNVIRPARVLVAA